MTINYEVQHHDGGFRKHSFDYQAAKAKYIKYNLMSMKEFKQVLSDPILIGEFGHHCSFILRMKQDKNNMMYSLEDYGIIHMIFHCLHFGKDYIKDNAKHIKKLHKTKIKLA